MLMLLYFFFTNYLADSQLRTTGGFAGWILKLFLYGHFKSQRMAFCFIIKKKMKSLIYDRVAVTDYIYTEFSQVKMFGDLLVKENRTFYFSPFHI
jgi:hypothetical protein